MDQLPGLSEAASLFPIDVEIRHRVGLPSIGKRLWQRSTLIFGAVASLVCIYMLSSIIWVIQIRGVDPVEQALIKEILKTNGIEAGVPRSSIRPRELETQLMMELPQLAWVGVGARGILLAVEAACKTEIAQDEKTPGDIVAGKGALVTQIIPFVGQAVVTEGETVVPGQVLIDGSLAAEDMSQHSEIIPYSGEEPHYLRASGVVKGRVWYSGFGEAGVVTYNRYRTGETYKGYHVAVGPWNWVWGVSRSPFPLFEESRVTKPFYWKRLDIRLPVRMDIIEFHELIEEKIEIDLESAKETALLNAWRDIESRLGPRTEILSQETEVFTEEQGGNVLIRAKRVVEVHEDIGVFRPLQAQTRVGREEND